MSTLATGNKFQWVLKRKEFIETQINAEAGEINRWKNYLNQRTLYSKWSNQENSKLLELHSIHGNHWKSIAQKLTGRTGIQVKNQFFNVIRILMRKAFRMHINHSQILKVSKIKPKILSEVMNIPLKRLYSGPGIEGPMSLNDFLIEVGNKKTNLEVEVIRKILLNIKDFISDIKFSNQSKLYHFSASPKWQSLGKLIQPKTMSRKLSQ